MRFFIMLALLSISISSHSETLIPRSMTENANYYLIDKEGSVKITTIHVRRSSKSTGFSKTEIDCINRMYRDLGYGADSQDNIKTYDPPGRWTRLVKGSSKSDLVNFVCK